MSLILVFIFLGFEFHYQTSKRALFFRPILVEVWFLRNVQLAKWIGTGFLFCSLFLSVLSFGFGAGVIAFIGLLMLVGGLVVVISPLGMQGNYWLGVGLGIWFFFELVSYAGQ